MPQRPFLCSLYNEINLLMNSQFVKEERTSSINIKQLTKKSKRLVCCKTIKIWRGISQINHKELRIHFTNCKLQKYLVALTIKVWDKNQNFISAKCFNQHRNRNVPECSEHISKAAQNYEHAQKYLESQIKIYHILCKHNDKLIKQETVFIFLVCFTIFNGNTKIIFFALVSKQTITF